MVWNLVCSRWIVTTSLLVHTTRRAWRRSAVCGLASVSTRLMARTIAFTSHVLFSHRCKTDRYLHRRVLSACHHSIFLLPPHECIPHDSLSPISSVSRMTCIMTGFVAKYVNISAKISSISSSECRILRGSMCPRRRCRPGGLCGF